MNKGKQTIPLQAARLIISFHLNTASIQEMEDLDTWVLANDDNMERFEEYVDFSLKRELVSGIPD